MFLRYHTIFIILVIIIIPIIVFYLKNKNDVSLGELELIAMTNSKLSDLQTQQLIDNFRDGRLSLDEDVVYDEDEIIRNLKFLTENDYNLLGEISPKKELSRSQISAFVADNEYILYKLCLNILNEEILQKFNGASDNKLEVLHTSMLWLVTELNKLSEQFFLNEQIRFYSSMDESDFKKKLLLEYFRRNAYGWDATLRISNGLSLARELNDTKATLDFYRRIQFRLKQFYGFNALALAFGKRILEQARQSQYYYLEAATHYYNGEAYLSKGDYRDAQKEYNKALAIYTLHNNATMINLMKERIAVIHRHLGVPEKALRQYKALLSQNPDKYYKMLYLHGIGLVYMDMGDFYKAEQFLNNSLNLSTELDDLTSKVITLGDLGSLNLKIGDKIKAREFFHTALTVLGDRVVPSSIIFAIQQLGELYIEVGDLQTAEMYLTKADSLCAQYNFGAKNAKNDFLLAKFNLMNNAPDSALKFINKSIIKLNEIGDICGKIEALTLAGEIHRQRQEYSLAESKLLQARELSSSLPKYANDWEIDYNLAKLNIDMDNKDFADNFLEQSIRHIETLTNRLPDYEKRVHFAHKIHAPYEAMILLQLNQENEKEALVYSDRARAQVLKLLLEKNRNQLLVAAGLMNLWNDEKPTLEKLQALLDDTSAVLEYEITKDEMIIWCIRNNSLAVKRIALTRVAADSVIMAFKNEMNVDKIATKDSAIASYSRVKASSRFLYDHLIKPVDSLIADVEMLHIIPDENLYHIPFAALMDTDSTFLLQRLDLAYAASAEILSQTFGESDVAFHGSEKSLLTVSVDEKGQAFEDGKKVVELFAGSKSLSGKMATETNFTDALGDANYDYILFSLHGFLSEKPMNSYLRLYAPSDTIDSRLTVEDIMNLKMLGTDLVYLAACESASGKVFRGEGVFSLQRAFMIAGVNTIIGNLWQVENTTTEDLTIRFFNNLNEYDKVEALRRAQLQTLDYFQNTYFYKIPHPYFWAPLTLSGATN